MCGSVLLLLKVLYTLREHLRAHKVVLCVGRPYLYFIDFIYEFHIQVINLVQKNVK